MFPQQRFLTVSLFSVALHCKLKRSVSALKCQMSYTVPGANLAHHGTILNIWCQFSLPWKSVQPLVEANLPLSAFQPLELGLLWSYRAVSTQ